MGTAPSPWDSSAKACLEQETAGESKGWERCSICQDCLNTANYRALSSLVPWVIKKKDSRDIVIWPIFC